MARQRLRFAVLCGGLHLEAWQAGAIKQLTSSGCADLVLVIAAHEGVGRPNSPLRARLARLMHRHGRGSRATTPINCSDLFRGVEWVRCQTRHRGCYLHFARLDVDIIASHGLDFIVNFQLHRLSGDVLSAARYGVWVYDFPDERSAVGAPSAQSAPATRARTREVKLLRLRGPESGVCLYHGVFPGNSAGVRRADAMRWSGAAFCLRACRAIMAGDLSFVDSTAVQSLATTEGPATLRELLWSAFHHVDDLVKFRLQKWFCYDLWNVGLVNKSLEDLCNASRLTDVAWSPYRFDDQYVADPFVVSDNDTLSLLVERFDYNETGKGRISLCEVTANNSWSDIDDVLDREYHLSYPYTFTCDGERYCMPESHEAGRCDLYRITGSGQLQFVRTILDGWDVIDPTIFSHGDFWWLFFSRGGSVELYAFYADMINGAWTEHALNPLKCDVRSARPAGPPFRRDGDLYRPAQDCSRTYGGAVVINRIIELAPDRFREEVVCRIAPEAAGAYRHGFHTLNVLDRKCVVDGKRRVIAPTWFLRGCVFGARTRHRLKMLQRRNQTG